MGLKKIMIKAKNKLVEKYKTRKEKSRFKKEIKKSTVDKHLDNIQTEISKYKAEADRYHKRILELKHNYLEEDKQMQTMDRKAMLEGIRAKQSPGIKYKPGVHPEATGETQSIKKTNPTLAELQNGTYTKEAQPPIRDLKKNWNTEKKIKQLNKEINPIIQKAKEVNLKIAKLEAIESTILAKHQLSGLNYEKIKPTHMSLINSIFSEYKNNKINGLGLREILKKINIEIEIMKSDNYSEKDIVERFSRMKRRIQELKKEDEQSKNVINIKKILSS